MALPKQIQKQSEEVQRLYKELNEEPSNTEDKEKEVSESVSEEPVEQQEPTQTAEQAEDSAGVQPTEKEETVEAESKSGGDFEQKYRTLQGMYNKEVPRLRSENRDLHDRLTKMEELLATMNQAQEQATQQPEVQNLVSEKEIEEYGEDTVDMFRRLSREEYLPYMQKLASLEQMLNNLQSNVVPQVENVVKSQARTAEERFWETLETSVPNWREINNNQDFQTWLLEYDPLVGNTRQSLLEQAQANMDASRVIQFFNTWNSLNQGSTSKATPNPSKSELEKQVAPGKGRSAGKAPTSSESRTYTPEDIKKFFEDVRKGEYKGREDERNRIERDIFSAQQQGRIVVNA